MARINKTLPPFTGIQGDTFHLRKPTTVIRARLERDIPVIHEGMQRATTDSEEDIQIPISEWEALNAFVSGTVRQIDRNEAYGAGEITEEDLITEYIEHMGPGPLMELYGNIWVCLWASDYGVNISDLEKVDG